MRAEVHRIHWMTLARCVVATIVAATVPAAFAQRSTPVQLLHPSGAASDQFGQAMAIDGDTMIVGAPFDDVGANANQGSAHIYRWTVSGWTFEATLTAAGGAANDQFGTSVTISGDTAIVGAFLDDVGANADQGSAYVFVRSGTTWTQQAQLTASGGAASDRFGNSVAITGDTAIVGANLDSVGANLNQGSAYVFTRSGTTWTQQAQLNAADGAGSDFFGGSVAIGAGGDTAIVGSSVDDVGANADQGSAYVFVRTGITWTQQARLNASGGAAGDLFGRSVAISGNTVIVGAYSDDVGANVSQGSSYIFVRSGTTWTQQAQLTATGGAASDQFGWSVAISGDTAVVGANFDDVDANANQGSAYVFVRSGTTWTQQAQLTATGGAANDQLGFSVAVSGDTAVAGASLDDVGANLDQGSAWVFSRIGDTWIGPDLQLLASDGAVSDRFGSSVAISGNTAILGAFADDVGANPDQGSAYVFVRSGTTWTQQAQLTAADGAASDNFGISVALSGDTAIVGAYSDDVGANVSQGSAYIFVRSGTTWTQQAQLTATGGAAGEQFGSSVAISGDTAIVGAYLDDVGSMVNQGSAYVFVRSGTIWTQQVQLNSLGGVAGDFFGRSVAISDDTAVVGANLDDVGANANQGSAYIFTRSGMTWTQQAQLNASGGAADDQFGFSVALSGDTAIVGAITDDVGANSDQGSAYVFVRTGTTWTQQAQLAAADGAANDQLGCSVALTGDTAVVGASFDDMGANTNQGSAYLITRSGTTWTQQTKITATNGAGLDLFGFSVALSEGTVIVGASFDDVGANGDQGSVWTFDVPTNDYSVAHNDVTALLYDTLAAAMLPATSGQQISATEAAWRTAAPIDTSGRRLSLQSWGDIRTPSTCSISIGGASTLAAAPGSALELFGPLSVPTSQTSTLASGSFRLGSRGSLRLFPNARLLVDTPVARLDAPVQLDSRASLDFSGDVTTYANLTAALFSDISTTGEFVNHAAWSATSASIGASRFTNRDTLNVLGTSGVFGDFLNEAGATTTITSGRLFVIGSLTNNGTIAGAVCNNCVGGPPNLDAEGDLVLGTAASLSVPFVGATVHVGGDFDCAINSNTRFDLSLATLQLEGTGSEQTLEVMSKDLGADPLGLDRTITGHYPIGVLEIGPSPSTVRLVDAHDNDGLGQSSCEAIYADEVIIHPGSHLINTTCRIYYNMLVNNGTVDVPSNLVAITTGPVCDSIDFNGDGLFPDTADIDDFLSVFSGGPCSTGTCNDIDFNNDGLFPDTLDIDSLLSVFSGGACL